MVDNENDIVSSFVILGITSSFVTFANNRFTISPPIDLFGEF